MSNVEQATTPDVEKFYRAICALEGFDCAKVRGVVQGMFTPTELETCFIGTYYRAALNIHSIVALNHPRHFQAVAQLARSLLELAVDLRLLGVVKDSAQKMMAFSDWERLKSAKEVVDLKGDDSEAELARNYIRDHEARIGEQRSALWPAGRLNHWSVMDLPTRVGKLAPPFDEIYKLQYRRLSWYVHSGLTGVLNFEAAAFPAVAGSALQVAAECYVDMLEAVIALLRLDRVFEQVYTELKVARMVAFCDSPEEAEAFRREMLG